MLFFPILDLNYKYTAVGWAAMKAALSAAMLFVLACVKSALRRDSGTLIIIFA